MDEWCRKLDGFQVSCAVPCLLSKGRGRSNGKSFRQQAHLLKKQRFNKIINDIAVNKPMFMQFLRHYSMQTVDGLLQLLDAPRAKRASNHWPWARTFRVVKPIFRCCTDTDFRCSDKKARHVHTAWHSGKRAKPSKAMPNKTRPTQTYPSHAKRNQTKQSLAKFCIACVCWSLCIILIYFRHCSF